MRPYATCKRTQQLPTLLRQQACCCVLVAVVFKRMQHLLTTRNNMQQGVQTDATCSIQICWSCWPTMLRPFSRCLIPFEPFVLSCTLGCMQTNGSCCIRLHTTAYTDATTPNIVGAITCNRVCKRTQHVTFNNVASVCMQP